jgi:hypothetical protein
MLLPIFHSLVLENKKQDHAEMIAPVVFWSSALIRIWPWTNEQTQISSANTIVLSAARKQNGGV